VLKTAQEARIVPKLFEVESNYIVMEYIDGPSLDQVLESHGFLPEGITKKNIDLTKRNEAFKVYSAGCKKIKTHPSDESRGAYRNRSCELLYKS
jgi:acetyl-CoA acetyltransferase